MLQDLDPAAPTDFDFILGDWLVLHERLDARLAGCTTWSCFEGRSSTRKTLGGWGNVEDNLLHLPSGDYRAAAVRSFDRISRTWAIWWLDGRSPHSLDQPVLGSFENGVGHFFQTTSWTVAPSACASPGTSMAMGSRDGSRRSRPTAAPTGRPTGACGSSAAAPE